MSPMRSQSQTANPRSNDKKLVNGFEIVKAKMIDVKQDSDYDNPYEEFTKSEDSQDLRNYERKVKNMIIGDLKKKYDRRCDKSLMKVSFLKSCEQTSGHALKNL